MKNIWFLLILFIIVCSSCRKPATSSSATPSEPVPKEASTTSFSQAESIMATLGITTANSLATTVATPNIGLSSGLIVFVGSQNQSKSIAIMTSSGQNRRFLTDTTGEDHHPKWSPDSNYIAFLSSRALPKGSDNRDLWLIDMTDQQLIQLTFEGKLHKFSSFVWAPDSRRIAYSQAEGPVNIIHLVNKVSQPLGHHLHAPLAWSPNGQWIAGEETVQIGEEFSVPGRFLTIVNPEENIAISSSYPLNTATSLDWAPDNQHLAIGTFFSNRGDGDLSLVSISRGQDISTEASLSESFDLVKKESVNDVSWSPDGKLIAFRLTTSDLLTRRLPEFGYVYITDSSLLNTFTIISEELLCNKPQWSPDSTKLIFACKGEGENVDIWITDRDGSNLQQLTDTPTYEGEPIWQPKQ